MGRTGGEKLAEMIRDAGRSIPFVVASEDSGFLMHPGLDDDFARYTAGLANVVSIDAEASWALTNTLGQEWSCFNGAIRLYWPFASEPGNPFAHYLWTASRLTHGMATTKEAAERICDQIRRIILGVSTVSVRRPLLIDAVRQAARQEEQAARQKELERQKQEAASLEDFIEIADGVHKDNEKLKAESEKLEAANKKLREELDQALENIRLIGQAWPQAPVSEVEPEQESPPATVEEAVAQARKQFSEDLVFGSDVAKGVEGLNPEAGPPDKILAYLRWLAEAARAKRSGPLGKTLIGWLGERGVIASSETALDRESPTERKKRTWNDGVEARCFDMHLKPSDGTSPDRCVRIYFVWRDEDKKMVVGWVGRHP